MTLGGFSALQKGGDAAFCHRIMRTGKDHWAHPVQLSASPTMPINLIPQPWHTALSTSSTFRQKTAISALSSGPLPWCPPAPKRCVDGEGTGSFEMGTSHPAMVAAPAPWHRGCAWCFRREQAAAGEPAHLNSCPANHPPEQELSDQRLLILKCDFVSKKLCRLQQ